LAKFFPPLPNRRNKKITPRKNIKPKNAFFWDDYLILIADDFYKSLIWQDKRNWVELSLGFLYLL
jgi:hypothetical protein